MAFLASSEVLTYTKFISGPSRYVIICKAVQKCVQVDH